MLQLHQLLVLCVSNTCFYMFQICLDQIKAHRIVIIWPWNLLLVLLTRQFSQYSKYFSVTPSPDNNKPWTFSYPVCYSKLLSFLYSTLPFVHFTETLFLPIGMVVPWILSAYPAKYLSVFMVPWRSTNRVGRNGFPLFSDSIVWRETFEKYVI